MRIVAILAAGLALTGAAAHAQEAMGTAGASGSPPTNETARQIDDWIARSPAAHDKDQDVLSGLTGAERQVHGEVGLAIGTNGYRSAYVTSVVPLGETGSLMLSLGQEKNGYYRYGYDGYGYDGFGRAGSQPMLTPPPPTW